MDRQGFIRMNDGKVYGFDSREVIWDKTICEGDTVWVDLVDGRVVQMWRV